MNCAINNPLEKSEPLYDGYIFKMSEYLSRSEIEKMISNAVESGVSRGVRDGMRHWQDEFGLKPDHWVFLKTLYSESKSNKGTLIKTVINAIVTGGVVLLVLGFKSWFSG